jgi:general L-amino acid transport system substrate-binding protein
MNHPASLARLLAVTIALASAAATPVTAGTLDTVKARGQVVCGVNQGLPGFAAPDASGRWRGFDVDFCRAVAAAIFGDGDKVTFVPLSTEDRFPALKSGRIDVLARNSTWTLSREAGFGLTFVGTTYYDGQGFLVHRSANVDSALELTGSTVCVQSGTTTETNLADYFAQDHMDYTPVVTATAEESAAAFGDGRCTVITSDVSQLYALRQRLADPAAAVILPEVISKEPLGPAVRQDDGQWATLVKWVHFALLDAEELGVASDNIDAALASRKPAVRRLVGDGSLGQGLGLDAEWAVRIVRAVGNYGEIYERNLGEGSPLGIPRGLNQLWSLGGIQYAPPVE